MSVLVSACLLGICCKYNGKHNANAEVLALAKEYSMVPICPEQLGGLATPRLPSECDTTDKETLRVFQSSGQEVTEAFLHGAELSLQIAKLTHCTCGLMKENSPSCGSRFLYDGSFSGVRVPGQGVAAKRLMEEGIPIFGETQIEKLKAFLKETEQKA